jgi:hypothetical protein
MKQLNFPSVHSIFSSLISDEEHLSINNIYETNIFEENQFLLRIRRNFETQNDYLSIIQCTDIIEKLPKIENGHVFRLHINWFNDDFIVYAIGLQGKFDFEKHCQYSMKNLQIVGLIEEPN